MIGYIQKLIPLIIYPGIACFLSLIFTYLAIKILPHMGLLDQPGGRHIHKKPTPKAGGIAIFGAFSVAVLAYWFSITDNNFSISNKLFLPMILVPAFFLTVIGLLDDKFNLNAKVKLLGQAAVAALCWGMGWKIESFFSIQLSPYLSLLITIIWICGFINAFNLIDGLDGLAAGLAVVSSICMAVWFVINKNMIGATSVLILAGACIGFLRYNFYPAKIFMGDTGSMFIGLIVALVGIPDYNKSVTFTAVLVPMLAAGVPIFDAGLAIWRRLVRGFLWRQESVNNQESKTKVSDNNGIMQGDRHHIHHRILDKNHDHKKTTLTLYLIGLIFAFAAILLMIFQNMAPAVGFIVVLLIFTALLRRIATVEMWDSTRFIIHGMKRPRAKLIFSLIHPLYDLTVLVFSIIFPLALLHEQVKLDYEVIICNVAPVIMIVLLSRIYRIYWLRADSGDYGYLAEILFLGFIGGMLVDYVTRAGSITHFGCFLSRHLISFLVCFVMIIGERLAIRHFQFVFMNNLYLRNFPQEEIPNTLIYGGGLYCKFFINNVACKVDKMPHRIIGIIDDETALHGEYVYGHKVLGGISQLEKICAVHNVGKIVLTTKAIPEKQVELVKNLCLKENIKFVKFTMFEKKII